MLLLRPKRDIAVVIPTANDDDRLAISLEGWRRQTDKDFEIYLVNDGGMTDTEAVVKRYRKLGLVIHYYYLPGGGYRPASARNLGISHAEHCSRIILSDADVIPCPVVVSEHRRYNRQKVYVLGMRRSIPRLVTESVLIPQMRFGLLDIGRIDEYPSTRDHRLNDPMFGRVFRHVLNGTEPTKEQASEFTQFFGVQLCELPGKLWQALFCWSFNVSYSGPGRRMNPNFDRNYGFEDIEFALRLINDGYRVVVNRKIMVYHLDHALRAQDSIKQYNTFKATLSSVLQGLNHAIDPT